MKKLYLAVGIIIALVIIVFIVREWYCSKGVEFQWGPNATNTVMFQRCASN